MKHQDILACVSIFLILFSFLHCNSHTKKQPQQNNTINAAADNSILNCETIPSFVKTHSATQPGRANGPWRSKAAAYRIIDSNQQMALSILGNQLTVEAIAESTSQLWSITNFSGPYNHLFNVATAQCLTNPDDPKVSKLGFSTSCSDGGLKLWYFTALSKDIYTILSYPDNRPFALLSATPQLLHSNTVNPPAWQIQAVDNKGSSVTVMCPHQKLTMSPYGVYLGGAFGLSQLLIVNDFRYVSDHADGYYHHPVGWRSLSSNQKEALAQSFVNKKSIIEGDIADGINGDVDNALELRAAGFAPFIGLTNEIGNNPNIWPARIAADHQANILSATMVASHVVLKYDQLWLDTAADPLKQQTLAGDGSSNDSPPYLFNQWGPGYRRTTYQIIDWMRASNRPYLSLISPGDPNTFLADTQAMVRALEDNNCEPDFYGVETYTPSTNLTPEILQASQNNPLPNPKTVTGIALWLLQHRDGIAGTLHLTTNAFEQIIDSHSSTITPLTIPATGHVASFSLSITNTSSSMDHTPVLVGNLPTGMNAQFILNGNDISTFVLSSHGYVFKDKERLYPNTSQQLEVKVTTCHRNLVFPLLLYPHPYSASSAAILQIITE